MWPFKKRKFSQLNITATKKKTDLNKTGEFEDIKSWIEGTKISAQLSKESELLKTIQLNPLFNKRNPKLEGAALVFKISKKEKVCEVVVEIRLPNGLINVMDNHTVTKVGRIIVYFQNIDDIPLNFKMLPEFLLTGNLLLPWKAGIIGLFSPHNNSIGEVITWQTTYNNLEEIKILPSEILVIIERCEIILEQFMTILNESKY